MGNNLSFQNKDDKAFSYFDKNKKFTSPFRFYV